MIETKNVTFPQTHFLDANPHKTARRICRHADLAWDQLPSIVEGLTIVRDTGAPVFQDDADRKLYREQLDAADYQLAELFKRCGSPIEEIFLAYCDRTMGFEWGPVAAVGSAGCFGLDGNQRLELTVQHKIGSHRVDFALTPLGSDTPVLAIELDGHEFHERTKKQAKADKARDRSILATGCPVVRFTGSEVWQDPAGCWRESLHLLGGTKAA